MWNKMIMMIVFFSFASLSMAGTLTADPKNSSILFKINHGESYTIGIFEDFSANIETNGDQIVSAKVRLNVNSINTRSGIRDEGLRSSIFFDVAKFPQANFESLKIEGDQMTGTLTIKGISKPITLTVGLKDGVFTAKGSFDRNNFGINYNRELFHHEKAIGNKIDLIVELKGQ